MRMTGAALMMEAVLCLLLILASGKVVGDTPIFKLLRNCLKRAASPKVMHCSQWNQQSIASHHGCKYQSPSAISESVDGLFHLQSP